MENPLSHTHQHREHNEWLKTLDFFQDEIKIFQNELVRVAAAHPDLPSIFEHVEEYRSLFLKKLEKIDGLRHQISLHEHLLAAKKNTTLPELTDHGKVREQMMETEANFEKLRTNFRRFASHND